MKVNDLITNVAFSHRPQDGISLGVAVIAGVAYMSVGFVRTGDAFNRRLARRIITQRIISTLEKDVESVGWVGVVEGLPEQVDARGIVRELRKAFKPDPTCNDATFSTVGKLGNVSVRAPLSRDESFNRIVKMFGDAVATASKQPAGQQA